jgi:hypothetical protein
MSKTIRPLAALALVALIGGAGCGASASSDSGGATATVHVQSLKFAQCMRDHGVSAFPDPDGSGGLTIDAVANGSSLDTNSAPFKQAISACKDLEPPGFTGRRRSTGQQQSALAFAQCMRDNGVPDFPDPTSDGPLIDTNKIPSARGRGARDIPGFDDAAHQCLKEHSAGVQVQR